MNIGQIIRALRRQRQRTLESLALETGLDASTLSRVERNQRKPAPEQLSKIAAALSTTVSALYEQLERGDSKHFPAELQSSEETDYTENAILMRDTFRKLTQENRHTVLEIARLMVRLQRGRE